MNLFDLAGVAVPAGFRSDGLPFGVTLIGPAGSERALLAQAEALHSACLTTLGATGVPRPPSGGPGDRKSRLAAGHVALAVCGAHMQGLPLNGQLRERAGYFIECTRTAPHYRLFCLPGGPPQRPGLVRVSADGAAIEVEVWALPCEQLASFIATIPAPLGIGKVELQNGALVAGFICEAYAATGAADITSYGGWRAYVG
jgi:allophanate hydrolase